MSKYRHAILFWHYHIRLMFVCVDILRPSQQFFQSYGTVTGLNEGESADSSIQRSNLGATCDLEPDTLSPEPPPLTIKVLN